MKRNTRLILLLLIALFPAVAVRAQTPKRATSASSDVWPIRMVVLPDTQYYYHLPRPSSILTWESMARWVSDSVKPMNIQAVLHVGDFVNNKKPYEYNGFSPGVSMFDNKTLYLIAEGNHDDHREYEKVYPLKRNAVNKAAFGGYYNAKAPNRMASMYLKKTINGMGFLFITAGWQDRKKGIDAGVMKWLNTVAANHPACKIIFVYHSLLYESPDGSVSWTRSGSAFWNGFLKKHSNIYMAFCGHVTDRSGDGIANGSRVDVGDKGNRVCTTLFNDQWVERGWMRIVEIYQDQRVVHKTYSPFKKQWKTGDAFEFIYNPSTSKSFAIKGSVSRAEGVTMTVSPGGMTATIDASGHYAFADMAKGTYTLTPSRGGYKFSPGSVRVSVTSGNATAPKLTALKTPAHTITAKAGPGGKIRIAPYGVPGASVSQVINTGSDSSAFCPEPTRECVFVRWSDGSTDNPRTFALVSKDITVSAEFAKIMRAVTFKTDGTRGASITGALKQTVAHGRKLTSVTAVAPKGFVFVSWTCAARREDKKNPFKDEWGVRGNETVIANFAPVKKKP